VDVVRDRGSIARMVGAGTIENVYRLQIMNATELAQTYRLRVEGIEGLHMVSADLVDVPSASRAVGGGPGASAARHGRAGLSCHSLSH